MLKSQERSAHRSLRTNFYLSARILYLFNQYQNGSILFGYALESVFKQALLEANNRPTKLQYSHDLVLLFNECRKIPEFRNVQVPNEFVEYSSSLFQIRYPTNQKKESKKAMERNNVIGWEMNLLFCYDDFFQQINEALYNFTNDCHSCSILMIFASVDNPPTRMGLHYNSAILKHFDLYRKRTEDIYKKNISSLQLLQNGAEYFWKDPKDTTLFADFNSSMNDRPLLSFKFPGRVNRDEKGNVTTIEFFF